MTPTACSLHPLDTRLFKLYIAAVGGGIIPSLREEATRRRQRDVLINWSRKIGRVCSDLSLSIDPDRWLLISQIRPFFITAEDPADVAAMVDALLAAHSLEEVLDLFREEVARLDPDQADALIDAARRDGTPGEIEHAPVEEVEANLRAYLLYQRHKLEEADSAPPEALAEIGRLLGWRAGMLIANLQPWWFTRSTSLTTLAGRGDLGLLPHTADPRGVYRELAADVPGLMARMPYNLMEGYRTGMCIPPRAVSDTLSLLQGWPKPIPPDMTYGTPSPVEIQAMQEALVYGLGHDLGVLEAANLVNPEDGVFPVIHAGQGEVDETLFVSTTTPTSTGGSHLLEQQQAYVRHLEPAAPAAPVEEAPVAEAEVAPAPEAPAKAPPFWAKFMPGKKK
jgi:hypothetical protein